MPESKSGGKKRLPALKGKKAKFTHKLNFPIVGIGASAGGLSAIETFFKSMPSNIELGIAFIIVQHLDPTHKSILNELVEKYTSMKVFQIEEGMKVQPNTIYIIPPNFDLAILNGSLNLIKPDEPRGLRLPIDYFFRTLSKDLHERAIGIILSGTGTDGTLGLKAIKGENGLTMVQSPESASYDGMPSSAISTGLIDYILSPDKMPEQLIRYAFHSLGKNIFPIESKNIQDDISLNRIFIIIRDKTGHDFSNYKRNTIIRRIDRRMVVNKIDRIEDYVFYLKSNSLEIEALFRELLIGVTNFFRDKPAYASLEQNVIEKLFKESKTKKTIRIWIPACSTGEEAYSIAMLMQEQNEKQETKISIQIFATDIDNGTIEKARVGKYPESIAVEVAPKHLKQFFIKEGNTYRVNKSIREMIIFAKHDVIKDPPFTKIDLLSCRNLLIYLSNELQSKIIQLFQYSLNPGGFLFLGSAESIGTFSDYFSPIDKKWKIYCKKDIFKQKTKFTFNSPFTNENMVQQKLPPNENDSKIDISRLAENTLLEDFSPPCVIINSNYDVLYIHGHTGKFLEPAKGEASLSLLKMAREGLKMELTTGIRKAMSLNESVNYQNLIIKNNGSEIYVNMTIRPLSKIVSSQVLIMVIFEEIQIKTKSGKNKPKAVITDKDQWITDLEKEVRNKDEFLQTTVEELETANEELKSTNEELQSSNEELQSSNEELETSKEELQSVNEELITVNSELQKNIEELSRVNNDMNNLLASTGIGTIFIDHNLSIQRFTPAATQIINLIQTDIGRPVSDIVTRLINYKTLEVDVQKVLNTLIPFEVIVQNKEGRNYNMRIQPYRTLNNVIEGAVMTFVEINPKNSF